MREKGGGGRGKELGFKSLGGSFILSCIIYLFFFTRLKSKKKKKKNLAPLFLFVLIFTTLEKNSDNFRPKAPSGEIQLKHFGPLKQFQLWIIPFSLVHLYLKQSNT